MLKRMLQDLLHKKLSSKRHYSRYSSSDYYKRQGGYPPHYPNHPNQHPNQYSNQYPNQYPNQNPNQYPNQHPNQYPNQYPNQHPNQYHHNQGYKYYRRKHKSYSSS
ncbi:hypothetical protein [Paenibacillus sp. GCM10012303]|uniref:hypothetical protein n=1 Tax=Paenibacillus sp. GCM10012303 TaxID=3317340 RepID=UPI00361CA15F